MLAPAIKLADEGFIIGAHTAKHIQSEFPGFPEHAKSFYGKDGKPLQAGDRLVQKDLARSLRLLSVQGAKVIHGGELGDAIDKEMRKAGGFLTLDDLKKNRAEWWDPVSIDYRGHKVVASPLPNNAWNGLYRLGITGELTIDNYQLLIVNCQCPAALPLQLEPIHKGQIREGEAPAEPQAREKLDDSAARQAPRPPVHNEEEHTTHFVIADSQGNCLTSTQTLGMLFGSKVMAPGTGIWLNNSMQFCTFEPKGNPLDALPGRRKLAGFCPMLVMRDGKPWNAVGSPGGHTIVQTNSSISNC